ncbi:YpiB family protein [Vaginisenegalia massiliensis]|uniref:YpiB family protein n=1 Tax=Vaginisenegalia massiliensis TaxID=2058294 RepID=UPI000F527391|nr:YpiB family protein [Vaginisenegalia massiliensis]
MVNINQRKREFLAWLLQTYQHVDPAVNYLLTYIVNQPHLIHWLHFSEEVKYCPRGIYISYQQFTAVPFVYFKDQRSYQQSEQAFHDLRLMMMVNPQPFYIELNMPNYFAALYRFDIFEENPYLPINRQEIEAFDQVFNHFSIQGRIRFLRQELDQALGHQELLLAEQYLDQIDLLEGELDED